MTQAQMQTIETDLLYEWQQYQVTKIVWKKLLDDFNPHSALMTCKPEDLGRHQGQAEMLEVLRSYFEIK